MISSIFSRPSAFSILAMIATSELQSLSIFLISRIASAFLTKEAAIKSTPSLIPNIMSSLSFSVIAGNFNFAFGIFTPFLSPSSPPAMTSQITSVSVIFFTFNSISPSSIKI